MRPLLVALYSALAAATASAADLTGQPERIHDGDTLRLGGVNVRLWGVDAPELKQECQDRAGASYGCGERARAALVELIGDRPVTCQHRDTDRYGCMVGACKAGNVDLNREMMRQGWAVAYTTFTRTYVGQEADAHRHGRGIWQGRFEAAFRSDELAEKGDHNGAVLWQRIGRAIAKLQEQTVPPRTPLN